MYSIKWAHKLRGLKDPTNNHFVTNLVEAAKRRNVRKIVKKDILSTEQIVSLCDKYHDSQNILVLRDLAIIVLCFSGFLRFEEAISLRCKDIKFHEHYMSVFLFKSKTDQYRKGDNIVIHKGNTNACPMKILSRYLECANIEADSDHFLFKPAYCAKGKTALIHKINTAFIHKNKLLSYTL